MEELVEGADEVPQGQPAVRDHTLASKSPPGNIQLFRDQKNLIWGSGDLYLVELGEVGGV